MREGHLLFLGCLLVDLGLLHLVGNLGVGVSGGLALLDTVAQLGGPTLDDPVQADQFLDHPLQQGPVLAQPCVATDRV